MYCFKKLLHCKTFYTIIREHNVLPDDGPVDWNMLE